MSRPAGHSSDGAPGRSGVGIAKVRAGLGIAPSESVLQAIMAPMEFTLVVNRVKDKIVGGGVYSERQWPVIGNCSLEVKDL
jgi:hypothetical protein